MSRQEVNKYLRVPLSGTCLGSAAFFFFVSGSTLSSYTVSAVSDTPNLEYKTKTFGQPKLELSETIAPL